MIKIGYDEIVKKIKEEKGISDEEIDKRINTKIEQLAGLISKEGAAHIIANELDVKIFKEGAIKVSEIISGMREVELNARVITLYGVVSFKKENREGKVASFLVGDETGKIRVVLWDNTHISHVETNMLKEGTIIKIKNAYVKDNQNGFKELHLGEKSGLTLNPEGIKIGEIGQGQTSGMIKSESKKISEINEDDRNVSVRGTIVQIFEPRYYEMCSECFKKVSMQEGRYVCPQHGIVNLRYGVIANFVLDDGSDSIRITAFRDVAEKLYNINNEQLMEMRTNSGKFEGIKDDILGRLVEVQGRVNKNLIFNRLELNANSLHELKAEELIREMES